MAYVTGTSANLAALLTDIRTACTDNGWTLSGDILHKGDAYVRTTTSGTALLLRGGTGKDGSNNLTGLAPRDCKFDGVTAQAITYPVTYHVFIFTSPDEVYIVINYESDFYQVAGFGLSDVSGLTGTGGWVASLRNVAYSGGFTCNTNGGGTSAFLGMFPFFYTNSDGNGTSQSFIHSDVDSQGWQGTAATQLPQTIAALTPLYALLPNVWNDQTVLLPHPVYVPRTSGNKVSLVADFKNFRLCRIDYHDPGDVITLGGDEWKLFPWYKKNASNAGDSISNVNDSGTFGFAVRYDGA